MPDLSGGPNIEKAIQWVKRNTLHGKGVAFSTNNRAISKVSTARLIPSLIANGEEALAVQYAAWLQEEQYPDGSFEFENEFFDSLICTCQVIEAWLEIAPGMPQLVPPLEKSKNWLAGRLQENGNKESELIQAACAACLKKVSSCLKDQPVHALAEESYQGLVHGFQSDPFYGTAKTFEEHLLRLNYLFDLGHYKECRAGLQSPSP